MKIFNKEEIKAVAADIFGRYPKADKVAVTADGTAFITNDGDQAAKNHSLKNASGKELQITNFTRDQFSNDAADNGLTDLFAAVKAAETVEALTALLEAEKAGENREKAIKAIDGKLNKLAKKA